MADTREDLLARLGREGRRVGSASTLHNHAAADLVGLHPSDWACLDVLDWTGPIPAGQLAEHVGMTSGAVTGVVDRLENMGLVRRVPDPDDRRRVIIDPRCKGDSELSAQFAHFSAAFDELTAVYSDEELAVIVDFLERANHALADSIDRMREAARERSSTAGAANG